MRHLLFILFSTLSLLVFSNSKVDSLKNITETTTDTTRIDALINLSTEYYSQNKFPKAIIYAKQAINDCNNHKNRLVKLNSLLSALYYSIGDYPTSLEYGLTSINNITKETDYLLAFDAYNNTGVAYTSLKQYDKALFNLNKILELTSDTNYLEKAIILHNIGEIYSNKKSFNKALDYFLLSEETLKKLGKEQSILMINIGNSYLNLNEFNKAGEYFNKALECSKSENSDYFFALANKYKADLLVKQNKYVQALILYNQAINTSKKIDAKEVLKVSYMGLVELYSKTNNTDSILRYTELVYAIKDSIFNKQKADKIAEMQISHKFIEKEQEIENLKIQNQLAEKKQKIYFAIFALVLLGSIIIFLIIYNRKVKKISEKISIKQSKEIIKYEKVIDNTDTEPKQTNKPKDTNSDLSEEYKSELEIEISKRIRKDKLYLKNDFSLDELAKLLETNRRYVSIVINERLGQNFNSVINEFRIKEAMKLMSDPEFSKYTIESISKEVGFNSISAFNRAFNKVAGVTPSAFMKSIKVSKVESL